MKGVNPGSETSEPFDESENASGPGFLPFAFLASLDPYGVRRQSDSGDGALGVGLPARCGNCTSHHHSFATS